VHFLLLVVEKVLFYVRMTETANRFWRFAPQVLCLDCLVWLNFFVFL